METYQIQTFDISGLTRTEQPKPTPGPGEVLLEMKAWSLNFRDYLMLQGQYNPNQPLPLVPLSDGVGEIVDAGEGVDSRKIGQRVVPLFFQNWEAGEPDVPKLKSALGGPLDGTLREYMTLPTNGVHSVPDYLTDSEAATLPCAALTAWHALFEEARLAPGDTVLCLGTGGVSLFALQLAKAAGAEVVITSSSDEKLDKARKLGADHTINYQKTANWGKKAKHLASCADGVDYVIEVGGKKTLDKSIRALRPGGQIALIGVLSGINPELNVTKVLMQNIRLQGIIVGHRQMFSHLAGGLQQSKVRPVINKTFDFDEVTEAFEYLETQKHLGKITIQK